METMTDFIFLGSKIIVDDDCSHEIKRYLLLGKKAMKNLNSVLKKQRYHFADKGSDSQSYGFSSSHVWMWEFFIVIKKAEHRRIDAFELWCWRRLMRVPSLDCKEIQPVHLKGDQSWVLCGRTDVGAETPILRPPDVKGWLIWEDPDAGKDWGHEKKGTTEDKMVGWHHWLNGHGFGRTLGVGDGQGGLACCSSLGRKESNTTDRLNWTDLNLWWR